MSTDDLNARKNNSRQTLSIIDSMQGQYLTAQVLQSSLQTQLQDIEDQTFYIQQQLSDLQVVTETYDREFKDRMDNPTKKPYFSTTQDWVLAMFFFTYGLFMIACVFYIYLRNKTSVLLVCLMIAIVFTLTYSIINLIRTFA